jgi:hypothetical protein
LTLKQYRCLTWLRHGQKVRFVYFRDNEFWYEQEDGFVFPVPYTDIATSKVTLMSEDRAIFFMRWIRKYIDSFKTSTEANIVEKPRYGNQPIEFEVKPSENIYRTDESN